MAHKRIACALIPDFSLAVCARDDSSLYRLPVVLADGPLETAALVAINRAARDAGVTMAMNVAQAGTICPGLVVKHQDKQREKALSAEVCKTLYRLSPFVQESEPGLYFLDASGLDLLYKDEKLFGQKIGKTMRRCRYPIRVGIASGKFVARVAAEATESRSLTIVPTGQERKFLAPLPVAHLPLSEETFEKLDALGLRTIGQLMTFPAHDMIERFGSEGVILSHLLRGEDTDFFRPETIDEPISQEMHLTYAINSTLTIASHLGQLLEEILATFKRTGLGCRKIVVTLFLDDGTEQEVTVAFDHLTASIDKFMRQFRQAMEKVTLLSPACGLKATIVDIGEIFAEQLRLRRDGGNRPDKDKNDILNDDSITRPSLNPSFLPEEHYRLSPARDIKRRKQRRIETVPGTRPRVPGKEDNSIWTTWTSSKHNIKPATPAGLAPGSVDDSTHTWHHPYCLNLIDGLRVLSQPYPVQVTATDGRMVTVTTGQNDHHTVTNMNGPWRLSGHWWNGSYDRLYYEVETDERRMYLMFFDRAESSWYMQGMFD